MLRQLKFSPSARPRSRQKVALRAEEMVAAKAGNGRGAGALALARTLLTLMIFAVAMVVSFSAKAKGSCADISADDVAVRVPESARSGGPFTLEWTSTAPACTAPHYLLIALPERTRFSGDGAIALAPGERAPHDISYRMEAMRLAIPLHVGANPDGALSVIPYVAGSMAIEWAVAVIGEDGSRVLEGGNLHLNLTSGVPKIVVQDVYAAEWPLETVASASGDYRLDIFSGHFRVTDTATGALVLAAEGYRPGFSPTSRFLHVFGEKSSQFRLFDLHAETMVIDLDRAGAGGRGFLIQGLEWSAGDSFLMVTYAGEGAVGFKEMLFDRPYRYRGDRCGACNGDESVVAIDLDQAMVALDGLAYSLLADEEVEDEELWKNSSLRIFLEQDPSAPLPRPARFAVRSGEPEWFLNGPRRTSLDYREGMPVFVAAVGEASPAEDGPEATGEAGALRRGAVALSRSELVNRDTRLARRLAALGIDLQPTAPLTFDQLTFLHALEDENEDGIDDSYRIEPGRAALARRLASSGIADAVDGRVFWLTRDHDTCGRASTHRAFNSMAQLWSWKQGPRLFQIVHYNCYVSTGALPAGIAFLVTAQDGEADYAILGETMDGEMDLYESYDTVEWIPEDKQPSLIDIQMHGTLRAFRPAETLIALLNAQGSLAVYDTARQKMLFSVKEVSEFAGVRTVAATTDGRHIVQINNNGRFFMYETAGGALVLAGRYLDDEVVVYGDDLRFDATPEGASHVHLKFPGDRRLYPLSQFEAVLRTPDMVARKLGGDALPLSPAAITAPPTVTLTLVSTGIATATVRLEAEGSAGLREIGIYRDGRLLETVAIVGHAAVVERNVAIHAETRALAAVAIDTSDAKSSVANISFGRAEPAEPAGRLFAVAVGTDSYEDRAIAPLRYAVKDARTFAEGVEKAGSRYYGAVRTHVLENTPNLSAVLPVRIEAIAAEMTDADTLFVHIAGHGLLGEDGGLYLADSATRADDLAGTAMAWRKLSDALASVPGRVFIFLDACHSGAAAAATNDQAVDSLLSSSRAPVNVIAASKGRQFSLEGGRFAGGAFTSALAAIFADVSAHDANANGALDFYELYQAVKQRVVTDTNGEQTPWVSRFDLVGDAPLL